MKAGLVLTSINDVQCLEGYFDNFKKYGHLEEVEVFMIPDVKTPFTAYERCRSLAKKGLHVVAPGPADCTKFLERIGLTSGMFPLNSDSRRNIGYLMALDAHVEFVISIDDDNFCKHDDFIAQHSCCTDIAEESVSARPGWFNPCELLTTDNGGIIYSRGFPYFAKTGSFLSTNDSGKFDLHANMGLWEGDPDLDAVTLLSMPRPTKSKSCIDSVVLRHDTWTPINSQNTSVRAEAVAAYYFIPMLPPVMDRDGDIFQGYFLQACMKHLNGHLRIGTPVVEHRRNTHNYFTDAQKELPCIILLEELLPWLTELKLSGSDYCEAYECLATELAVWAVHCCQTKLAISLPATPYLLMVAKHMKEWAKACRVIGTAKVSA